MQETRNTYAAREARIRLTPKCNFRYFVCHGGGGLECDTAGGPVTLVSPSSPIAEAAIGRRVNDVFTVNGKIDYIIREVA